MTGSLDRNRKHFCHNLLGEAKNDNILKGCCRNLPWLAKQLNNFDHLLEDNVEEEQLQKYVRAYMITIIKVQYFVDKCNSS